MGNFSTPAVVFLLMYGNSLIQCKLGQQREFSLNEGQLVTKLLQLTH